MKKNKLKEIRLKTEEELKKEAEQIVQEITRLRLEIAASKIKNVKAVKNLKKDLAQIKTIIKEKGLKNE